MALLKLFALDADDLEIISAHLQDAVVKVRDLVWLAAEKRFVAVLHRFAWEEEMSRLHAKKSGQASMRHLSGLRFDRVMAVRASGVDYNRSEDVLALLALRFYSGEAPGGTVELVFAGNAVMRLEVECIEMQLTDIGPAWQTGSCPQHR